MRRATAHACEPGAFSPSSKRGRTREPGRACRGSWRPAAVHSCAATRRTAPNSPRVRFAHVGPLFKGEMCSRKTNRSPEARTRLAPPFPRRLRITHKSRCPVFRPVRADRLWPTEQPTQSASRGEAGADIPGAPEARQIRWLPYGPTLLRCSNSHLSPLPGLSVAFQSLSHGSPFDKLTASPWATIWQPCRAFRNSPEARTR
jgi:hypothetical protein